MALSWILLIYCAIFQLVRTYRYAIAGKGYCKDYINLPEGFYPSLLGSTDPLYSTDRIRECMNRCVFAAEQGYIGIESDDPISDKAFTIRRSDQHCQCSSGSCSSIRSDGTYSREYTSYHTQYIVPGKWLHIINQIMSQKIDKYMEHWKNLNELSVYKF